MLTSFALPSSTRALSGKRNAAVAQSHGPSCPCCGARVLSASSRASGTRRSQRLAVLAQAAATADTATVQKLEAALAKPNENDLNWRHHTIMEHFPTALGVDDWISRVETVLAGFGFTGDNSIAMTNLCRDEVTAVVKDKIESVFGSSFNTNGLGGVLTCGVTGMGAGLSHSPICNNGRERYVFFSFPHIAINSAGTVGSISRPGRAGSSCACGALAKCLGELKKEGFDGSVKEPGVHDALDPEYSILKQRLARRLRYENTKLEDLTLPSITAAAERTITSDLEFLIEQAVDTSKADYAVVTGVQIHNWASDLGEGIPSSPSLEFVAPTKFFVVINGKKMHLDLSKVPSLSPRQLMLMASASIGDIGAEAGGDSAAVSRGTGTTLQEIPLPYMVKRLGGASIPNMGTVEETYDPAVMFGAEGAAAENGVNTTFKPTN